MADEIRINFRNIKKSFNNIFGNSKKIGNILIIILLLALLIGGSWIRLQNLPLLKDQTSGEYIPIALDPFYFLRIAETMISPEGLPSHDVMRYPAAQVDFSQEILPDMIVFMYKIAYTFSSDISIQYIDVISPVIFFMLGLIAFYFLVFLLTKSKLTAALSTIFLTFIPSYLYRTMTGFTDHEAIGMFAFFVALAVYSFSLNYLEKNKINKKAYLNSFIFGLLLAIASIFTLASWGGIASFIFMIIPLSFFLVWIIRFRDEEQKNSLIKYLIFYITWFIGSILIGGLYYGNFSSIFSKIALNLSSMVNPFVLLFIISDYFIICYRNKLKIINKKYRILFSALVTVIIAVIALGIIKGDLISFVGDLVNRLLHPFGSGRTGLTVAENRQPYLTEWIGQIGKFFFWLFFIGIVTFGAKLSNILEKKKDKIIFSFMWIVLVSGIMFSRISSSSLLNGEYPISKLFYIGSIILFFVYFIFIYFKKKIKLNSQLMLILAFSFFMLVSARGAIRLFFVITPFTCFISGYGLVEIGKFLRKSKDDLAKLILGILLITMIIIGFLSLNNFMVSSLAQASSTGPSADSQWQKAMQWVRENTAEGSLFTHWWDYGYWVEYLGQRPALSDGGHAIGYWDHLVGRYILTTPDPNTALSMMKTHDVSYLLIDPTDIGKYPAFSKIGSDESGEDRYSGIPSFIKSESQTKDTANGTLNFYQGGFFVDEDIIYNSSGKEIFIPKNVGAIGAVMFEEVKEMNNTALKQPYGIYIYNNQQILIPLRYAYYSSTIYDFGGGLDAMAYVIPSVMQTSSQLKLDPSGAVLFLSKKVKNSLLAQLYLIGNESGKYASFSLEHSEPAPIMNYLNSQGANLGDFAYINGVQGPIKIWSVEYSENININEEFLKTSGKYAELDNLTFTR